jgi:DNA polymerase III delta subunit
MIIICSGPDTWQARRKKQELASAFKAKFDVAGFSAETIDADIKTVANQLGTPSFFASKRLLMTEGLLHKVPIAEIRLLAKRVKADAEQTILLDLEQEAPTQKILDEFSDSNLHHYAYPLPSPRDFSKWLAKRGEELGVTKQQVARLAENLNGDTWLAEQELMKLAANPRAESTVLDQDENSIFSSLEKYLEEKPGWRRELQEHAEEQVLNTLLSQCRAALRVRDGATAGLHPFQVKKISALDKKYFSKKFRKGAATLVATRSGIATQSEFDALI